VEHIKEIVEKTYRTKRVHCLGIFSIKMIRLSSSLDEMQQQFLQQAYFEAIILRHVNRADSSDKRKIPFPICSGVPGIGKTRLLENWGDMVRPAIESVAIKSVDGFRCKLDYVLVIGELLQRSLSSAL
jgi:hypothetical protein